MRAVMEMEGKQLPYLRKTNKRERDILKGLGVSHVQSC